MNRLRPTSHLRRAALLLAALLHLLGVAAGPALHGWLRADPHLPGISGERHEALQAPHDELACVICQAATGNALPSGSASPVLTSPRWTAPAGRLISLHAAPARSGLNARAPPVSIA
jgi:hypothetical protein